MCRPRRSAGYAPPGRSWSGPNCRGRRADADGPACSRPSSEGAGAGSRSPTVLSQSGNMVIDLDDRSCARVGLGISRFVSLGNQADLTVVDLMQSCVGASTARRRVLRSTPRTWSTVAAFVACRSRARCDAGKAGRAARTGGRYLTPPPAERPLAHRVAHDRRQGGRRRLCGSAGVQRVESPLEQLIDLLLRAGQPPRAVRRTAGGRTHRRRRARRGRGRCGVGEPLGLNVAAVRPVTWRSS